MVTGTTGSSVSLKWNSSTDDVGVMKYEVYVNGLKKHSTTDTAFIVSGLSPNQVFNFTVTALDFVNNTSPFSNQVTARSVVSGLKYKYYTFTTIWNNLPDFNTLTPVSTGVMPDIALNLRTQNDNFAFLWEGYITIPATGSYYFKTNSDDGSRLWLGALNATGSPYSFSATPVVNNDGLHASQDAISNVLNLTAGIYPIAIAFYEQDGGESMTVSWRTPSSGTNYVAIPSYLFGEAQASPGPIPVKPSNLNAVAVSHKRINLSWTDNSTNETAFELWRSVNPFSNFITIAQVAPNSVSYADTVLNANTKYYYRIRALGQSGESDYDLAGQGVDYTYYEQNALTSLPNFNAIPVIKSGRITNFNLGVQNRSDHFQLKCSTTINIPTTGLYTFYTISNDGSKLYIDGFTEAQKVVDNDGVHALQERSGTKHLTKGNHLIYVTFFENDGDESLIVRMAGPGLSKQTIPDFYLGTPFATATTLAGTIAPSYPNNLVATATSKTSVTVTWTDRATTESSFELYRSNTSNTDYILYATLPANTTSFVDNGLFANAIFYYKVRAVNVGGSSIFTNEDSAKTYNSNPVITDLTNRTARYGVTTVITLKATDEDGDAVIFSGQNLPAFATLVNNGNRTATLTLNPTSAQQGIYNNIIIKVIDAFGAEDITQFNLTVNDNYDPVIIAIPNYSVNENGVLNISLSASDQNAGHQLTWLVSDLPNAYTLTPGANGSATLSLQPTYASAGNYTVVVKVTDGNGGVTTRSFNLVVNDVNPNKRIYVRFNGGDAIGNPWNTVTGVTSNNFKDEQNATTSIGLNMQSTVWFTRNDGPSTGNNSGLYPDAVLKNYFYSGTWWTNNTVNGVLNGLDPAKRYNITFYGGTLWHELTQDNGSTNYTVGTKTVSLNVENNTRNNVSINNIVPAANGTITFTMEKGAGASAAILNAFVVYELHNDGIAPAAPTSLSAQNLPGQGIQLLWQDLSYNEGEFEIHRATNAAGPFVIIGSATAETVTYIDKTFTGNTAYYYKVRSKNSFAESAFTNTVFIVSSNRIPQIAAINNVTLKNNQSLQVNITATDDATDNVRLSASNLPSFVTLTDNGNGTGVLNIQPTKGILGLFENVTVTATDNSDSSRSTSFSILVQDNDVTRIYLNFADGALYGGQPWNNLASWPFGGLTYSNTIKDDNNTNTSVTVTLTDGFQGVGQIGMRPGNGKQIYPENVMRTGIYDTSTIAKRIVIGGLNNSKKYNFIFFNSRDEGQNTTTKFIIGVDTVTLNGTYNFSKTVQINGITPTSGNVTIRVLKGTMAEYAMINTMIIEEYTSALLLAPINLQVTKSKLNSITLNWEDREDTETGYEIWRAAAGSNSYALLATTVTNVTSYIDSNLLENRSFYYIVRAKQNPSTYSQFSNEVLGYTYAYTLNINFSNNRSAFVPWNNTNALPQNGFVWNNFKDNTGVAASVGMSVTSLWDGLYDYGMTGAGIFPENVMIESYGLFPGNSGKLKLTGLRSDLKYNLTFFASSQSTGDLTGAYTVNDQTVRINAARNNSGAITMYEVVADKFGNAEITVTPGTSSSQFGLIGALIIQAFTPVNVTEPVPPPAALVQEIIVETRVEPTPQLKAYPNPFNNNFTLTIEAQANEKLDVMIYDLSGKLVYQKQYTGLTKGMNNINVHPDIKLASGMYMIKAGFSNRKDYKLVKLIKQ